MYVCSSCCRQDSFLAAFCSTSFPIPRSSPQLHPDQRTSSPSSTFLGSMRILQCCKNSDMSLQDVLHAFRLEISCRTLFFCHARLSVMLIGHQAGHHVQQRLRLSSSSCSCRISVCCQDLCTLTVDS